MAGFSHPSHPTPLSAVPIPHHDPHAPPGRLRGFLSGAREIDDAAVVVRGELPAWVRGHLLLNGPALWELPKGSYQHWLDGLAMLHRIRLGDGEPTYRSRFLRSEDYRLSTAMQRPAMGGFGTDDRPGIFRRLRSIVAPQVTDNAAVIMSRIGSQWVATTETPRVIGFDADSLETTGEIRFTDKERIHLMAAHAINTDDGTWWNVGVELGPTCTYKLFRVRPGSLQREVVAAIKCKAAGYLHAFAMTPEHAVIWEPALRARALSFVFTGNAYIDNFHWMPEAGSRIHTVELATGRVQSWNVPPFMAFHAVQAYESMGDVVLEISTYDDASIVQELQLDPRRRGVPVAATPRFTRYRLDPERTSTEPETIALGIDLPQVHPSCWARRQARVAWGSGGDGLTDPPFTDVTFRIDLATGGLHLWRRPGAVQLEPTIVAPPGSTNEDEALLFVPTLTDDDTGTVIVVLDALHMTPVAELQLPQVLPFGFHATFAQR